MIVQLEYQQSVYVEVDIESGEVVRVIEATDGPTPSSNVIVTAWHRDTSGTLCSWSPGREEAEKAAAIAETAEWPEMEWGY
jgi:hypothetical protein